jgi:hypothetical protein
MADILTDIWNEFLPNSGLWHCRYISLLYAKDLLRESSWPISGYSHSRGWNKKSSASCFFYSHHCFPLAYNLVCVRRMYPKVSGLAAWRENCKWYRSLPIGAVVSLGVLWDILVSFVTITLCVASQRVMPKVSGHFVIDTIRKLLDIFS